MADLARYSVILDLKTNTESLDTTKVKEESTKLNETYTKGAKAVREQEKNTKKLNTQQKQNVKTSKQLRKEGVAMIKDVRVLGLSYGGTAAQMAKLRGGFALLGRAFVSSTRLSRTQLKGVASLTKGFGLLGISQRAVRGASIVFARAMNIVKIALISTGIGAIVIAFGGLIAFFTATERGADKLKQAFAGVGAAFAVIVDAGSKLGEKVFNAFTDENGDFSITTGLKNLAETIKNNVINRFKSLLVFGEAIGKLFEGEFAEAASIAKTAAIQLATGLDEVAQSEVSDALKEMVTDMKDEAAAAMALEEQLQNLKRAQRDLAVEFAQGRSLTRRLTQDVDDITLSYTQRIEAAEKIFKIEDDLSKRRVALAQEEVAIIRAQNALGESSFADVQKRADAEIRAAQIVTESQRKQTTNLVKLNALIEARAKAIKKLADEYEDLKVKIALATSTDPIQKIFIQTAAAIEKLDKIRGTKLLGLEKLGLTDEDLEIAKDRINENYDGLTDLAIKKGKEAIKKINSINKLPSGLDNIALIEQFIAGNKDVKITDIIDEEQFNALRKRMIAISQDLAKIGDIDSIDELNLSERLKKELKEVKDLLAQAGQLKGPKVEKPDDDKTPSFFARLLGIDEDELGRLQEDLDAALGQIKQFTDSVLAEQVRRLDTDIAIQKERVDKAQGLADKGNAELLQSEQERLEKLQNQREKALQRQRQLAALEIAINQAIAASNSIKAISNAVAQPFPANLVAVPLVLGLLAQIATATTSITNAFGEVPSFFDGIEKTGRGDIDGRGGFAAVLHPDERVVPKIHNDKMGDIKNSELPLAVDFYKNFKDIPRHSYTSALRNQSGLSTLKTERKLDRLIEIGEAEKTVISLDEKGLNVYRERMVQRRIKKMKSIA